MIVIALGIGAGIWWRHHQQARDVEPPFPLAVCDGQVNHIDAMVTSELRLHQALLPDGVLSNAVLQAAVALQLRYAFAVEQNAPESSAMMTPDGPPKSIELLEQRPVQYGNDIEIDWSFVSEIQPESDYVRRALKQRRIAATDPAIAITYRARVVLAACEKKSNATRTSIQFPAPLDPYLLYWHVDKQRRITHEYGAKRALTFPCATSEIADYDHPEYLWYFWQPLQTEHDCRALLRPGRELTQATLQITHREAPSGDLTRLWRSLHAASDAPPLRVALVFGYLDHQTARPDLEQLRECLFKRLNTGCNYDEFGTAQYARFLEHLPSVLTSEGGMVTIQSHGLTAEYFGRLPRSGRRVIVTAHLTETDFMAPAAYIPRHTTLLLDALRQADVFVYAGHSGLGQNFSVAQLKKSAGDAAAIDALRSSPVRVLGFIGCYTYSYFGKDFAALLKRPGETGQDTMFVYTGNAVSETADSALHILSTLDCILGTPDGSQAQTRCRLPPPGESRSPDFLIYDYAR